MAHPLSPRARLGLVLATTGCLLIGAYAVVLTASGYRLLPADIAANGFPLALRLHITTAGVALLLVPWQLWPTLRRRSPALHRRLGKAYAFAALAGGVSGLAAAFTTQHGPVAAAGFAALGLAWTGTTLAALRAALRRDLVTHRRWALRSFSGAFAAVTLRLELPLAAAVGISFETAYPLVAWLCWVPNLLAVQWWLARRPVDAAPRPLTRV
jgi:uncharacterized membrane protein